MNLLAALNWRYAVRKFSSQQLPKHQLNTLLEATRLSASSYGLQPYKIIVVKSSETREQLLPHSYGQEKVVNCSHLLVIASHTNIGDHTVDRYIEQYLATTHQPMSTITDYSAQMKASLANMNTQQKLQWAHQQSYIALGNLLTSAALLQIDSCPMTGFDNAQYDQILGLSEQHLTASVICAIGFRHPQDTSAQRKKIRFPTQAMVLER